MRATGSWGLSPATAVLSSPRHRARSGTAKHALRCFAPRDCSRSRAQQRAAAATQSRWSRSTPARAASSARHARRARCGAGALRREPARDAGGPDAGDAPAQTREHDDAARSLPDEAVRDRAVRDRQHDAARRRRDARTRRATCCGPTARTSSAGCTCRRARRSTPATWIAWMFPVGTKVWKEFSLDGKRLETRLLWKTDATAGSGWRSRGTTTAATRSRRRAARRDVGGTTHDVPTRSDCGDCHEGVARHAARRQRDSALARRAGRERCKRWRERRPAQRTAPSGDFRLPDTTEWNALGYLHANCGNCHNPRPAGLGSRRSRPVAAHGRAVGAERDAELQEHGAGALDRHRAAA